MGKSVQTIHNVMTHACKALFLAGDCQPVSDNRNWYDNQRPTASHCVKLADQQDANYS